MVLDTEIATYNRLKPELLAHHKGKWTLIYGEEFIDAFDTPRNARSAGLKLFGSVPMLIRQIQEQEPIYYNAWAVNRTDARI